MLSSAPWGLQGRQIGQDIAAIHFPKLTGTGETIAVIDETGIDYTDPLLGGGFGPGHRVIAGYDFFAKSPDPRTLPLDDDAHGTGTAATAAGSGYVYNGSYYQGIAPGANIVALRAGGKTNGLALDWIIKNRVKYNIVAVETVVAETRFSSQFTELLNDGVFIGCPSGNKGPGNAPALTPGIVETGSLAPDGTVSPFTERGSHMGMCAPGENVVVPRDVKGLPTEVLAAGTSWASPQVVGAAVLIKQISPRFTPAQILSILQKTGTPVFDRVSNQTYRELNLDAALKLATRQARRLHAHRAGRAKH